VYTVFNLKGLISGKVQSGPVDYVWPFSTICSKRNPVYAVSKVNQSTASGNFFQKCTSDLNTALNVDISTRLYLELKIAKWENT